MHYIIHYYWQGTCISPYDMLTWRIELCHRIFMVTLWTQSWHVFVLLQYAKFNMAWGSPAFSQFIVRLVLMIACSQYILHCQVNSEERKIWQIQVEIFSSPNKMYPSRSDVDISTQSQGSRNDAFIGIMGHPRWLSGLTRSLHSLMIPRRSFCPEKLGSNPGQGSKGINFSGWHGLDMSVTVTKRR